MTLLLADSSCLPTCLPLCSHALQEKEGALYTLEAEFWLRVRALACVLSATHAYSRTTHLRSPIRLPTP